MQLPPNLIDVPPQPQEKTKSGNKHDNVDAIPIQAVDEQSDRPKVFAITSSAAPRHLNDVAMAPPELKEEAPTA